MLKDIVTVVNQLTRMITNAMFKIRKKTSVHFRLIGTHSLSRLCVDCESGKKGEGRSERLVICNCGWMQNREQEEGEWPEKACFVVLATKQLCWFRFSTTSVKTFKVSSEILRVFEKTLKPLSLVFLLLCKVYQGLLTNLSLFVTSGEILGSFFTSSEQQQRLPHIVFNVPIEREKLSIKAPKVESP